jgi:hypothetical protein
MHSNVLFFRSHVYNNSTSNKGKNTRHGWRLAQSGNPGELVVRAGAIPGKQDLHGCKSCVLLFCRNADFFCVFPVVCMCIRQFTVYAVVLCLELITDHLAEDIHKRFRVNVFIN